MESRKNQWGKTGAKPRISGVDSTEYSNKSRFLFQTKLEIMETSIFEFINLIDQNYVLGLKAVLTSLKQRK